MILQKNIYFSFYCKVFNRMSAREAMIPHSSPKSPLIFLVNMNSRHSQTCTIGYVPLQEGLGEGSLGNHLLAKSWV